MRKRVHQWYLWIEQHLPLFWPLHHCYCPCGCGAFRWRYWAWLWRDA